MSRFQLLGTRCALIALAFVAFSETARSLRAQDSPPAELETLWIVPHTHWEGAVFKTREEYLEVGFPHILQALHLLRTQPEFRFVLDQVAYVRPFLERYPEQAADFRKFVDEGRLEIVLGMNVMPDVNMPGGETFVRQMLYGRSYYRERLGVDVKLAWLVDTFGHHAQMPQLLTQSGYTSFWFSRGVPKPDFPSEFLWQGIDGSRIPAFWLPYSYGIMYGSPRELPAFRDFVLQRHGMLTPNAHGPHRLGLAGVDVCPPEPHLAPLIDQYNQQSELRPRLRLAAPSDFERIINQRTDRPVFQGELNPIFQGTYSSRIELKHWMRLMEERLTLAEKLSVMVRGFDANAKVPDLMAIWEPVLFNQTHDLASGVMTDHVYEDTVRSYEFALRAANSAIEALWSTFSSQIDTSGSGTPIVVFNPLGWSRSDLVEVSLSIAEEGAKQVEIRDAAGRVVPSQVLSQSFDETGGLLSARVAFVARDVPSVGYAVFHAVSSKVPPAETKSGASDNTLANDDYVVTIDPSTGVLASVKHKSKGIEYLAGPGNVISRRVDKGDLWELDRGLDGGSKIAMTNVQPVPRTDTAVLSTEFPATTGRFSTGLVLSEFTLDRPFDTGTLETKVRVIHGTRRIEFQTTITNKEKYVHYQCLFPASVKQGVSVHEIPFGAIERPAGIEFPAQNWVDHSGVNGGLALLNNGVPGNVVSEDTLMLSLLRSHNLGAYGFGGGYEPGMSSESGFQIDTPRTTRYAIVPHEASWSADLVFREGLEFNNPLLVRKAKAHSGRLPSRWGLVSISDPSVVLSTLKLGPKNTVIARVYQATGKPAAELGLDWAREVSFDPTSVLETNLMEIPAKEKPRVQANQVLLDLGPFQIKTISLNLSNSSSKP